MLALALAGCVSTSELEPRHAPSGHDFPMPSAEFAVYAAAAEARSPTPIRRSRGHWRQPSSRTGAIRAGAGAQAVRAAADGGYEKAALLIHDLGGTPYEMRDVARAFADACYLVRAILLPGHGTVPGDLLNVEYRQWVDATRSAVKSFEGAAQRLTLVGFGLGGTLALHYALSDAPRKVELDGLVLLAPALEAETPLAWLRASGIPGELIPGQPWARLLPDYDPVRYESLPRNALMQRARLIGEVAAQDAALQIPVFLAISADDAEVDAGAARDWFCRRLSGPRQLIWYTRTPGPSTDCPFISKDRARIRPISSISRTSPCRSLPTTRATARTAAIRTARITIGKIARTG